MLIWVVNLGLEAVLVDAVLVGKMFLVERLGKHFRFDLE
jgi:hypothetical protein